MSATVAVLGAGAWGTALALQLARTGQQVRLWGHHPEHISRLDHERCNTRYLPGIPFPGNLQPVTDFATAVSGAALVLVVVPSNAFADILARLRRLLAPDCGLAWATKGLEPGSSRLLHEVVREQLGGNRPLAVVSGPSFATEVAAGLPTAITVAASTTEFARQVASLLHGGTLRAYTSDDLVGVQLGGAVKNVLAIATGIADGLACGANSRAALITRGLAELVRLGEAMGGARDTFMGLTGVGDLVLTTTDDQSRNRRFGLAIGHGQRAAEVLAVMGQTVEGYHAAGAVLRLAQHHAIDMPICEQTAAIMYHDLAPQQAITNLLARPPRAEC